MTITPTYKFPSGYMGGHLPLASRISLAAFILTYLKLLLQSPEPDPGHELSSSYPSMYPRWASQWKRANFRAI